MKKRAAVCIPAYKNQLNEYEEIALKSAINVFGHAYDIFVLLPESLKTDLYSREGVREKRFADKWFESRRDYSELCLQTELYVQFSEYEYLLLYQLDGFAFYDRLEYFCDMGYDYIGAPWEIGAIWYKNQKETVWHVGNGGVSLRKVDTFIKFTQLEEVREDAAVEPEDMVISSRGHLLKIAPVGIARQFCITECFPTSGQFPMLLHHFDGLDSPYYIEEIKRLGYHFPEGQPLHAGMNPVERKKNIDYWKNEFELSKVQHALDSLFGRPLGECYIWGAGYLGALIYRMFGELGIHIVAYIDGDEKRQAHLFRNKEVKAFSKIKKEGIPILICVMDSRASKAIRGQLEQARWVKNKDYVLWKDFAILSGLYKGGLL